MAPKRPAPLTNGGASASKSKMKQGSLFSFFKKATPAATSNANDSASAAKGASASASSTSASAKALAPSRPAAAAAASAPAKAAFASSASATATPKTKTNATNNSNKKDAKVASKAPPLTTGTRVEVYWPDDDTYYAATITKLRQRQNQTSYYLEYEIDGNCEWLDLSTVTYRLLSSDNGNADPAAAAAAAGLPPLQQQKQDSSKRRRIQLDDNEEESDEEAEFEMDDASESEESAYKANQGEDDEEDLEVDEEDDDQWMVTDDEDDTGNKKKKSKPTAKKNKGKVTMQVTEHLAPSTQTSTLPASANRRTPKKVTPAGSKTNLANFSYSSQSQSQSQQSQPQSSQKTPILSSTASRNFSQQHQSPLLTPQPTQQSVGSPQQLTQTTTPKKIIPMYTKGAVNPAGSHVHNHLKFLQNPRDAQGRTPDHADYDPRTLKVVLADWVSHCDKMTDAVKQWWDLKAQYLDTVLLFKTGKFYELFHMDADAGVLALGCAYMKGHVAHAGFPEISYGTMAHKLVLAGYKVARVEQTETPDQLKIRRQKHNKSKGPAPKVVNREVCSVMTLGTRTFCFLDDESGIVDGSENNGTGPLLAIREVLLDPMDVADVSNSNSPSDEESVVQPVCEYGITLVDAVRGTVTLGQFADDVLRSRMNTLLATFAPSEVRARCVMVDCDGSIDLVTFQYCVEVLVQSCFVLTIFFLSTKIAVYRYFWKAVRTVLHRLSSLSFALYRRLRSKRFGSRRFVRRRAFPNRPHSMPVSSGSSSAEEIRFIRGRWKKR
jgi:DNA mismatch repair protein MSH6